MDIAWFPTDKVLLEKNNTYFIKKCFLGNDLVTVIPFSVKDRRKYTLCEFNIDQGHFIIFFFFGREGGKHPV